MSIILWMEATVSYLLWNRLERNELLLEWQACFRHALQTIDFLLQTASLNNILLEHVLGCKNVRI